MSAILGLMVWYIDGPYRAEYRGNPDDIDALIEALLDVDEQLARMIGTGSLRDEGAL